MPLRPTAFFYIFLLPIVILLWAWADSRRYATTWEKVIAEDHVILVTLDDSRIRIRSLHPPQALPERTLYRRWDDRPLGRFFHERSPRPEDDTWFPAMEVRHAYLNERPGFPYRQIARIVPFWLILAAYLPAWLGLSYYYARRKRKSIIATLPTPPQAHSTFEN